MNTNITKRSFKIALVLFLCGGLIMIDWSAFEFAINTYIQHSSVTGLFGFLCLLFAQSLLIAIIMTYVWLFIWREIISFALNTKKEE